MKLWEQYFTPRTIDELIHLLGTQNARIIAGGTDLLVDMRAEGASPLPALIDITSIPELGSLSEEGDEIVIGAGVTHTQIVKSALMTQHATCLVESCGVIGGPQIRNVGTLGGNVAHALPAGDGTTSLVALNARVDIYKEGAFQTLPILDMYQGPGKSLLDSSHDALLRIRLPKLKAGEGSAFSRIMRPQGVALPIMGCAVWVRVADGHFTESRVCLAPVAGTPQRISAIEDALRGAPINEASIQKAIQRAEEAIKPRTSKYRATADYRKEMIGVLLRRTLPLAAERATTGNVIPQGIGG